MLQTWVIFIVLYGILKGLREPIKKNILKKVDLLTTLFVYTAVGFLLSAPTAEGVLDIPPNIFGWILVKCLAIFVAWIAAFVGLKKVPVSLYGITDMSRVIFSTLMGVIFLGESLTLKGIVSLILVVLGLYFANSKKGKNAEEYRAKYIWLIILSCALNAVSGTLDKYIMASGEITSSALQFWFMAITSIMYLVYMLIKKHKIDLKNALKNPWIYVLSISLIVGDRLLFIANANPLSQVTVMTLIKQSAAIVTIVSGKVLYNEKNITKKLICAGVILTGIVLAVI